MRGVVDHLKHSQVRRTARVKDQGLLESAVLRPRNRHHYERVEDLVERGAAYAEGTSGQSLGFDGNKQVDSVNGYGSGRFSDKQEAVDRPGECTGVPITNPTAMLALSTRAAPTGRDLARNQGSSCWPWPTGTATVGSNETSVPLVRPSPAGRRGSKSSACPDSIRNIRAANRGRRRRRPGARAA